MGRNFLFKTFLEPAQVENVFFDFLTAKNEEKLKKYFFFEQVKKLFCPFCGPKIKFKVSVIKKLPRGKICLFFVIKLIFETRY